MDQGKGKIIDGLQGFCVLVGITLGLIPLATWIFQGRVSGLFQWIFGAASGSTGYLGPVIVIVAAIVLIGILEAIKRRN